MQPNKQLINYKIQKHQKKICYTTKTKNQNSLQKQLQKKLKHTYHLKNILQTIKASTSLQKYKHKKIGRAHV